MMGHVEELIEKLNNNKLLTDGKYVYALSSVKCIDNMDIYVVCTYAVPVSVYECTPVGITPLYEWGRGIQCSDRELEDFKEWDKPMTSTEAQEYLESHSGSIVCEQTGTKYFVNTVKCPNFEGELAIVFSHNGYIGGLSMECYLSNFADRFDGSTYYIGEDD